MDLVTFESALRRRILGVLAATPLVAAAACGGDGQKTDCQTCFCGLPLPPPETYSVTYVTCAPPDDLDASDASDADVPDAADASGSVCFTSCFEACEMNRPSSSSGGAPQCVGESASDGGERVAQCELEHICGRRFEGLEEARGGESFGEMLARMAWLEAASIHAFRRLARELAVHGAPRDIIGAARACARDEARHARTMARLARAHGAKVPRVEAKPMRIRDLESIARENAVEACVGETYGALVASWDADHASDDGLRAAMRSIAPDELRHAALGWAVAAWADERLDVDARERVSAARERAVAELLQNATGAHAELAVRMRDAVWS